MKYICLGYYDKSKHDAMTEAQKDAMFDACFAYDDHECNNHRNQEQSRRLPICRLPGTNLRDEWIGDLPLIAEVVASQLAKITTPTGGNTSRTGSNGNPHPPVPDAVPPP